MSAWRREADVEAGKVVDAQSEVERELREQIKALRAEVKRLREDNARWIKLASK